MNPQPDRKKLLKESEVAEQLQISEKTLRNWRLLRKGINYVKVGTAIRYKQQDVDNFIAMRTISL